MNAVGDIRLLIRTHGLKATPARIKVFELLAKKRKPLSPQEVVFHLKKTADQATVYRILRDLWAAGLIKRIDFQHSHAHYEIALDNDHHHIVCSSCGKTEDVMKCNLEFAQQKILASSKLFASIDRHSLEFYGLCKNCKK